MRLIETDTLSNQNISSALLAGTYTADAARLVFARVFLDQIAGNGSYSAYATIQRAGAGSEYKSQVTTEAVASGVTSLVLTTIGIPLTSTDVLKIYVDGLAGDTTTPDLIVEFWEDDAVTPTGTLTEAYAADGAAVTLAQALYEILQFHNEREVGATTVTVKKRDGTTTAYTLTYDADSITRAT